MKVFAFIVSIIILFLHTESKVHLETDSKPLLEMLLKGESHINKTNERPIIGIWTQSRNDTHDYIVAAYVKFAEMAGARVIPLMYNDTDEHLIDLTSQINGVIYPGGGTNLTYKNGSLTEYSRKGKVVLDKIKQMNDNGIHFPVLGICLGMQEITVIEAPYPDVLQKKKFDSDDIASNVTFSSELISSKLYKSISPALIDAIQHENITYNHHESGVFPETFKKYPSLQEYLMLGVSYDLKGLEYTASIENKKYPIFGFQYHPEKKRIYLGIKAPRSTLKECC